MKKQLFYLLAFLPIFLFTACSSDDDDTMVTLNGTTWISPDDGDGVRVLKFGKKEFYYTITSKEKTESDEGTYTYNPPFVSLTYINFETNKLETIIGRIDGDNLILGEITYTKVR